MENLWEIPLTLVTGVFAGFLNTVAGGGSLLTLAFFRFIHLDPGLANGTNRVAIFVQNASAITGFRRKGVSDFGYSVVLTLPALAGAGIGAVLANMMDKDPVLFDRIVAGIMLAVLFLTLFNPTKKLKGEVEKLSVPRKVVGMIAFFFIGIYGGFIQAGVGFIIITALTLINGFDLVRTNAIKVFVIFFYTIIALVVFIKEGNVDWIRGPILAVGNATGAWIGSHWAVEKGDKWIKVVLVVTMLAFAIRLFWQTLG